MSWAFNPPAPTAEPVRSGLRQEGFGDHAPAVAPYYRLRAAHVPGSLIPQVLGEWVLTHVVQTGRPFDGSPGSHADPLAPRLWEGPRMTTNVFLDGVRLEFYWQLWFADEHRGETPASSWSVVLRPAWGDEEQSYVVWDDVLMATIVNLFLPLGRSTFHSKTLAEGLPTLASLLIDTPDAITVEAWWP